MYFTAFFFRVIVFSRSKRLFFSKTQAKLYPVVVFLRFAWEWCDSNIRLAKSASLKLHKTRAFLKFSGANLRLVETRLPFFNFFDPIFDPGKRGQK